MKYPYIVNHNGEWYPAGTEVPEDVDVDKVVAEVAAKMLGEKAEEESKEESEAKKYTKSEINRMNAQTLRKVAEEFGIEDPKEYTSSELKEMLMEKL